MKRILIVLMLIFVVAGISSSAGEHQFAGTKKCKMCHKGEKNGMIYEKWAEGPHAKAFTVLGEPAAMEAYKKLGKKGMPQTDPSCLKCHITGFGSDSAMVASVVIADGISCESCHGAGGDYWKKPIMMDKEKSIANGMTAHPKEVCVSCHNAESPTYKEFKLEEYWTKISHSKPKKTE